MMFNSPPVKLDLSLLSDVYSLIDTNNIVGRLAPDSGNVAGGHLRHCGELQYNVIRYYNLQYIVANLHAYKLQQVAGFLPFC